MGYYRIKVELESAEPFEAIAGPLLRYISNFGVDCQSVRVSNLGLVDVQPQPVGAHGEHGVADGAAVMCGGSGKPSPVVNADSVAGPGPASVGESKERAVDSLAGRYAWADFIRRSNSVGGISFGHNSFTIGPNGEIVNVHTLDLDNSGTVRQDTDATPKHAGASAPAQAGAVPDAPVHSDNAGAVGVGAAGNGGAGAVVKADSSASPTLTRVSHSFGVTTYVDKLGRIWHCMGSD